MYAKDKLIEDGLYNESKSYSHKVIAEFYEAQLEKFEKIGLGGSTENDTVVTKSLIEVTRKRLKQLKPLITMRRGRKRKNEGNK